MLTLCRRRGWTSRLLLVGVALGVGCLLLARVDPVQADGPVAGSSAAQECVTCHATPGLSMQLASGETVSVSVDPQVFSQSAHGGVLQCSACHPDDIGYPHPAESVLRPSARSIPFLVRTYTNCGSCHPEEYDQYVGSVHAQALNEGKSDSAICSDCHGAHDIGQAKPSEVGLSLVAAVYSCGNCHKDEFEQYKNSVHGKALLEEGNLDVPSCVDCHGVHDTHQAKDSASFRAQSVAMCSGCHGNSRLMAKYGLSTHILSTYVSDFHGTSAQFFSAKSGQAPEQALCYDCHSAHNIQSTVGANGLVLQDNLLAACQQCHKDANANFPAAWLGHDNPSPEQSPLVFWVRGIYNVLISGTVLLLVGHISLDIRRVLLNTLHQGNQFHE